jgi:hypothetical protein
MNCLKDSRFNHDRGSWNPYSARTPYFLWTCLLHRSTRLKCVLKCTHVYVFLKCNLCIRQWPSCHLQRHICTKCITQSHNEAGVLSVWRPYFFHSLKYLNMFRLNVGLRVRVTFCPANLVFVHYRYSITLRLLHEAYSKPYSIFLRNCR